MCLILIELVEFALEHSAEGRDEIDVIFFFPVVWFLYLFIIIVTLSPSLLLMFNEKLMFFKGFAGHTQPCGSSWDRMLDPL